MYLFEGDFGRVLHTGDFRWELASQPDLLAQPALAGPPIDRLYLDNTYCAPWCGRLASIACSSPALALCASDSRGR